MSEIIILCNSAPCLNEISSGLWPNLHQRNIFTCNFAYTYFRTSGRHLNIMSDAQPIKNFLEHPDWQNVYDTFLHNGIEYIFSRWDLETKGLSVTKHHSCRAITKWSPVAVPASSAINALLYLSEAESFETIYLLGYTINEWEGIGAVKELQGKKQALDKLLKKYSVEKIRDYVYRYARR